MKKQHIIPFLLAFLLLVLSEYFFVRELFGAAHVVMLLLTGAGIASGIFSIVSLIKKI